ncbi:uronyl 2-sulfotransferase-like [Amphiura filiformis]|uniref:uronyl 2-sulfotransferase-like n=1 Tax=Amphiura filiformis TaxID=82378 RepID=UPI003B218814
MKVIFARSRLLFVSATILLTWMYYMYYSSTSSVENTHVSEPYEWNELELVQETERTTVRSAFLQLQNQQALSVNNFTTQVIYTGNNSFRANLAATTLAHNSTKTSLEKQIRMWVNYYKWNDIDPDSFKSLPLKSEEDRPAQLQDRVVFNRVGKCGSRSVIFLLRHLAIINNFNMISSAIYNQTRIDEAWQERLVHSIELFKTPFIFEKHLHYVNFPKYGSKLPVYINIIRDPLARLVSFYYYTRFGDVGHNVSYTGTAEKRYQTFDDCVLQQNKTCTGINAFKIVPFFCGQHKDCKFPSLWALNQAINNVEENYLFVGILEELEDSLRVLEKLLPSMFTHALEYYLHPVVKDMSSTVTVNKKKPSPEVQKIMKDAMQFEYQFYNFVRNKFHKTRDELGITPYTSKPSSGNTGKTLEKGNVY